MGGSRPFRVLPVLLIYPVFAASIMPNFQEYGVALHRVLCGEMEKVGEFLLLLAVALGKHIVWISVAHQVALSRGRLRWRVYILRLAAGNCIGVRFPHSTPLRFGRKGNVG